MSAGSDFNSVSYRLTRHGVSQQRIVGLGGKFPRREFACCGDQDPARRKARTNRMIIVSSAMSLVAMPGPVHDWAKSGVGMV